MHHTTRFRRDPLTELAIAALIAGMVAGVLFGLCLAPTFYGWAG